MCPAPDHLFFLTLLVMSRTFISALCPRCLSLSLYAMLSILFPLLSVRPQVSSVLARRVSIYLSHNSLQHTGVVHVSLQADDKVTFNEILVFGVCSPACQDSSLYLFDLVLFIDAVVLRSGIHSLFAHSP